MNNRKGGWSSKGCVYDGKVNGRDVCLCNHLTNFAVLIVSSKLHGLSYDNKKSVGRLVNIFFGDNCNED